MASPITGEWLNGWAGKNTDHGMQSWMNNLNEKQNSKSVSSASPNSVRYAATWRPAVWLGGLHLWHYTASPTDFSLQGFLWYITGFVAIKHQPNGLTEEQFFACPILVCFAIVCNHVLQKRSLIIARLGLWCQSQSGSTILHSLINGTHEIEEIS